MGWEGAMSWEGAVGGEEVANSQTNKIRNFYRAEILIKIKGLGISNQFTISSRQLS